MIVVGVLIALWADQWWSDRQEAETERAYLAALANDIALAVEQLDRVSAEASAGYEAARTLLALPPEGPFPANDSLVQLLAGALFNVFSYDHSLSAHEDLKNTGRLGLISDRRIRRGLAEVDRQLDAIRLNEQDLLGAQHATFDPLLLRRTDLVAVAAAGYPPAAEAIGPASGLDHTPLLRDREVRGAVALRIVILKVLGERYQTLKEHLLSLREITESRDFDGESSMDAERLQEFGARYTAAWNSGDPENVAAFFVETGSLKVNDAAPAEGREAIAEVARGFMTAFPDMVLTMDSVRVTDAGAEYHWTFAGTNSGPGGTGNAVRFSGYEEWTFGEDGLVARSLGHFDEEVYARQLEVGVGVPDGS